MKPAKRTALAALRERRALIMASTPMGLYDPLTGEVVDNLAEHPRQWRAFLRAQLKYARTTGNVKLRRAFERMWSRLPADWQGERPPRSLKAVLAAH